jgi:hypothetical protein
MAPAAEATGRRDGDGDVVGFALLVSKEKERPWNATERLLVVVVVPALGPPASPTAALAAGPGRGRSTETERLGSGDAKRREGVEAEVEVELELEEVVVVVEVEVEVEVDMDLEEGPRR